MGTYDICVRSGRSAMAALNGIKQIIDIYGIATVADLKDLLAYPIITKENTHTGWANVDSATISFNKEGSEYILRLPRPMEVGA